MVNSTDDDTTITTVEPELEPEVVTYTSLRKAIHNLTFPIPTYLTHPHLLDPIHYSIEHELAKNPFQTNRWLSYLNLIEEEVVSDVLKYRLLDHQQQQSSSLEVVILGDKLALPSGRIGLQKLVEVYERALHHHQFESYTLWKKYLAIRSEYILGSAQIKVKLDATSKKRIQEDGRPGRSIMEYLKAVTPTPGGEENGGIGVEPLEIGERDVDAEWLGGLDGVIGYEEWISLAAVHERALMYLPQMPRIWLSYFTLFLHPKCPSTLSTTHARKTFDRALRTLPRSLHERIWKIYLQWASIQTRGGLEGGETTIRIWRRYLSCEAGPTSYFIDLLLKLQQRQQQQQQDDVDQEGQAGSRALEANKLALGLVLKSHRGEYKDSTKSNYQLLIDWLNICERYAEQIGIDLETSLKREKERKEKREKQVVNEQQQQQVVLIHNNNNGRGGINNNNSRSKDSHPFDPALNPISTERIDVEYYVRSIGLNVYQDQAGKLWTGLATYWIKKGEFDHAKQVFEEGLATVLTLKDFTQIFDAYAEFSESYISGLMESIASVAASEEEEQVDEVDEEQLKQDEKELDLKMIEFEQLMDRRPFLVNDVLLRRNPNDVQEWEKRIALHGIENDQEIVKTYTKAIKTINPRKSTTGFHSLWIHFAKFYEVGGSKSFVGDEDGNGNGNDERVKDLIGARKVFEKAVQVPFKKVDELAEVWCEWAEMEVRNENYDEAIRVMQRATTIPKKWKEISFHDEKLSVQSRLFKSIKLWSFFVDLEESIGTIESTKNVYDQIFELKIATAQIVINYANFLEENQFWEESFKVYERGVDLFSYPIAFEIWNAYLSKFIKRYGGEKLERARDLFEQALKECPEKFTKPLFLLYGQLEEEHGLAKRAMAVYDRATRAVESKDRLEMFTYYIAKATANFGLPATRPIYERAIEQLPDRQTAEMCLRFAALERKLGEIDRARAIFAHASQFCDPRVETKFWQVWNTFEIETGSEDTFREYLRIKRAVQAAFNTEASYLAAKLQQVQRGGVQAIEAVHGGIEIDPMAALDAATGVQNKTLTGFVKAQATATGGVKGNVGGGEEEQGEKGASTSGNQDEIVMDDDDDEEE